MNLMFMTSKMLGGILEKTNPKVKLGTYVLDDYVVENPTCNTTSYPIVLQTLITLYGFIRMCQLIVKKNAQAFFRRLMS